MIYKILGAVFVLMAVPVVAKWFIFWLPGWNRKQLRRQKRREKEVLKAQMQIIYDKELKQYYNQSVILFKSLSRSGKLRRDDYLIFKRLLDKLLGEFLHDYDGWIYPNDAAEIYTKLKSIYYDRHDWETILEFLSQRGDAL